MASKMMFQEISEINSYISKKNAEFATKTGKKKNTLGYASSPRVNTSPIPFHTQHTPEHLLLPSPRLGFVGENGPNKGKRLNI